MSATHSAKLRDELGVETVEDLLDTYPRRYAERGEMVDIASAEPGQDVTLIGYVTRVSSQYMRSGRRGKIYKVDFGDQPNEPTSTIEVVFFNDRSFEQPGRFIGRRMAVFGTVKDFKGQRSLSHPSYEMIDETDETGDAGAAVDTRPLPIYPATKKLSSNVVRQCVARVLDSGFHRRLADPLPESVREAERLIGLEEAYRRIHRPDEVREVDAARRRLAFQEAFLLQTVLATRRAARQAEPATPRPARANGALNAFDAALPFKLTSGQRETGERIADELAQPHPMNRLLQGEVGSGKTLVALRAMLQVIDAGGQTALIAPTEVLAEQHLRSILEALGPLASGPVGAPSRDADDLLDGEGMLGSAGTDVSGGPRVRVELLTGSMPTKRKKQVLLDLAAGTVDLIIGTHALVQDKVSIAELGLLVVDEQHRFGVEQRDALRTRADIPPHVLVMTATPIPRTIAMTTFGDLAVSTLTELPAGRQPIATHLVCLESHPTWAARIWARIREEVDAGRQAFVVCPLIADSSGQGTGGAPMTSVESTYAYLAQQPALAGLRLEPLHGGMPSEDKDAVMVAFSRGEIDVLISTTVIEVGVNVPNATVMVVLDADRFGVAQLHQLRGRIGRGSEAGTCLLVTQLPEQHPSVERLQAVAQTTDGLALSEYDVETRKEGDVLGSTQSGGTSSLRLVKVTRDGELIARARKQAFELVAADRQLAEHAPLRAALARLDDDRREYLERA
nr:ATP-dependent DNA helicase RecG [Zhihengliuella flava]